MRKKHFTLILLEFMILASFLSIMVFGVEEIRITDEGVIGSTDIEQDGDVFRFTSHIYAQIIIERDNIVLDGGRDNGYSLQPTSGMNGIILNKRHSVIIRNTAILGAKNGIKLENSYDCTIEDCVISDSQLTGIRIKDCLKRNMIMGNEVLGAEDDGIILSNSTDTVIVGNTVEGIDGDGLDVEYSTGNYIHGNTIENIVYQALDLDHSHGNYIYENDCSGSFNNVYLFRSSDNHIFHNNFMESRGSQVDIELSKNIWNKAYPSGGNYWFGYEGVDELIGVDQSQVSPIGDGIGDSPNYVNHIDDENVDWLPLMKPYKPRISCQPDLPSVSLGESITISGTLSPNPGIAEVILVFTRPDGLTDEHSTLTNDDGDYSAEYRPAVGGSWTVTAGWVGESGFGGAVSEVCSFQVTLLVIVPGPVVESRIEFEVYSPTRNKIWIKGDVFSGVDWLTEVDLEIVLRNPEGIPYSPTSIRTRTEEERLNSEALFDVKILDITEAIVDGEWSVTVSYEGGINISGSFSTETFEISAELRKISTRISFEGSNQVVSYKKSVIITGNLIPPLSNVPIRVKLSDPNGTLTIHEARRSGENGEVGITFDTNSFGCGYWRYTVIYDGDETYAPCTAYWEVLVEETNNFFDCFIATATYGSELSPEVQFLRKFRDTQVQSTFAGHNFMQAFNMFYYSFSPYIAEVIASNQLLRWFMKLFLYPLIAILHLTSDVFNILKPIPEIGVIFSGFFASGLIGIVYFYPIALLVLIKKRVEVSSRTIRFQGSVWLISVSFMLLSILFRSSLLMMLSTGAFVLLTMSASILITYRWTRKQLQMRAQ